MEVIDIDESKPDFFDKLMNLYKHKIIIGRKTAEDVLDYMKKKYGINYLTKNDLTEKKMELYHDVNQMICRYDDLLIYELNPEGESKKFYEYHEDNYAKGYPILIFYSKEKGFLDSNCVLLQCEIKIVEGIDKNDVSSHSAKFKDYLNNLYLLEWTMKNRE